MKQEVYPENDTIRQEIGKVIVGQDKVIHKIRLLARRGLAGRGYWISGQSGTGKTTLARLIAAGVASEWSTEELDAQALTPARLREIERAMKYRARR